MACVRYSVIGLYGSVRPPVLHKNPGIAAIAFYGRIYKRNASHLWATDDSDFSPLYNIVGSVGDVLILTDNDSYNARYLLDAPYYGHPDRVPRMYLGLPETNRFFNSHILRRIAVEETNKQFFSAFHDQIKGRIEQILVRYSTYIITNFYASLQS